MAASERVSQALSAFSELTCHFRGGAQSGDRRTRRKGQSCCFVREEGEGVWVLIMQSEV